MDPAPSALALRSDRAPAELLRTARAQLEAGQLEAGLELLAWIARAHPIIGDYADSLRIEALVESGQLSSAVAAVLDAL